MSTPPSAHPSTQPSTQRVLTLVRDNPEIALEFILALGRDPVSLGWAADLTAAPTRAERGHAFARFASSLQGYDPTWAGIELWSVDWPAVIDVVEVVSDDLFGLGTGLGSLS